MNCAERVYRGETMSGQANKRLEEAIRKAAEDVIRKAAEDVIRKAAEDVILALFNVYDMDSGRIPLARALKSVRTLEVPYED
jgi:hypothetical protein